jgi:LPPG:FO 2-phospho-L-lactate transferase
VKQKMVNLVFAGWISMANPRAFDLQVVALAGGVGGAKLVDGLAKVLPPGRLTVVVNTGDDLDYLGLRVCPDLDTVCYALAGLANPITGWGRKDESWTVYETVAQLGGPDWFHIGDHDLATHLERTRLLKSGKSLAEVTSILNRAWKIGCTVLPMSDQPVSTRVETDSGEILDFQDYFVRQGWQPVVKQIQFSGIENARPAPGVIPAIQSADIVIICPSNPIVSIEPILSIRGIREAIMTRPVVAVSPIIGGKAIKGPLAKMIAELYNQQPTAEWVADYYRQHLRLDGFILDRQDNTLMPGLNSRGIICKAIQSIMLVEADRIDVARAVLEFSTNLLGRN